MLLFLFFYISLFIIALTIKIFFSIITLNIQNLFRIIYACLVKINKYKKRPANCFIHLKKDVCYSMHYYYTVLAIIEL